MALQLDSSVQGLEKERGLIYPVKNWLINGGSFMPLPWTGYAGGNPWTVLDDLHRESLVKLLDQQGIALDEATIDRVNHFGTN
ncbi:hypothetical protein HSBAA_44830 [Vreelandella sulfidaeris]|uniref:Uncharacterized protein n=1 Tax=Vreelandella sulfidaeris TaxID=115553 RepID=A0A455UC42_9GAMM|nr:hypothetical protein HSBAA_44830 [Halomonas sulfidaeris]